MADRIKIAVGSEDFEEIRKENQYYVDKTEMIYELVELTSNKVTLFTRPRRFGKTLTLSMLKSFFDITKDSRDVFEGLDVTRHTDFCEKWMNQYPVLFLSLKDVDGLDFYPAFRELLSTLADYCKTVAYLLKDDGIDPADAELFERLRYKTASLDDVKGSLKVLMRMLYTVHGRPVILLIDEYDVPLAKAHEKGYYTEMLDVIRSIMSLSMKTNDYLKLAVVTGCLRIAKESIFTGVNNFRSYSVLDEEFSQYFGFTQDEINDLLEKTERTGKSDTIKAWYDGYIFGNSAVYCPWDVISYVATLLRRENALPANYWENTSGNTIILEFLERDDFNVSADFETLLNGGTIRKTISDSLTYNILYESEDNIWSVLFMTGYLTKANPLETGSTIDLRIPNHEITGTFERTVENYFRGTVDKGRLGKLMDSLWDGDETAASELFSSLLWDTISYHNYSEAYYQAFLTGIFVGRGYACETDNEHGLGRADIVLKDRKRRRAIIIETKKSLTESDMESDCQKGIKQIVDRKYADGLEGYRQIMCYGVAFYKKNALVRKL